MYVTPNCKSKKELKERIAHGERVTVFQPGIFKCQKDGVGSVEGPNYRSHTWYAEVEITNYVVTKVR